MLQQPKPRAAEMAAAAEAAAVAQRERNAAETTAAAQREREAAEAEAVAQRDREAAESATAATRSAATAALHDAAKRGHVDVVRQLLDGGMDVNDRDEAGKQRVAHVLRLPRLLCVHLQVCGHWVIRSR